MEIISERTSVVKDKDSLSIVITSSTDRKKIFFMQLILLLWIAGGAAIVISFKTFSGENVKMMAIVWIAFWVYFLYVMSKAWMWFRFGKEVIKVHDGKFLYKRDIRGKGWVHTFSADNIQNFHEPEDKTPSWLKNFGGDFWSTEATSFTFHSNGRDFYFGFRLSEKEKDRINRLLKQYLGKKN